MLLLLLRAAAPASAQEFTYRGFGQIQSTVYPQSTPQDDEHVAVEALLRWQHPALGLIYPDTFIPLAERTGQIKPLTSWVLAEAVAQSGRWVRAGTPMSVAVNLSARNLLDHHLVAQMEELLQAGDADAWREVRTRNGDWLKQWEATLPPGERDPAGSYLQVVRRLRRLARQGQAMRRCMSAISSLAARSTVSFAT